jgi:hypothetical protein
MTLKLALAFAEAGCPVFPVDVFYDSDRRRWRKVPCIKDWEGRATTNRYLIEVWWCKWPCAMPGTPPGRINKVIVDADRHYGGSEVELFRGLDRTRGPFPPHPVSTTKSGGEHHWFAQPVRPVRWVKWVGGEVLGHSRFVVGYAVPQGECPVLPEVFWKGAEFEPINNPMGSAAKTDRHASAADPMVCGLATAHERNYANAALRNHVAELWMCREGARNIKLNALAFNKGRLIARGWIARDRVEGFLLNACKANRLLADDGESQCWATIASGTNAGMKRPYHNIDSAKLGGNAAA